MLIDWFTVGAQTLNFLILVWLLKRFLYRPVLDAIDAREKAIAATLAEAAARQRQAQEQQAEFTKKNSDFDAQRAELLAEATAQAQAERARLLAAAGAQADQLRVKRDNALQAEDAQLRTDIAVRASEQVLSIARKALRELAGLTLEQQICETFLQRLRTLDAVSRATLAAAVAAAGGQARCRSASALSASQQSALAAALDDACASKTTLAFETSPHLISGIELDAHGYQLAWSIDAYLASFGQSIGEAVRARAPGGANAGAAPEPAQPAAPAP